MSSSRSILHTRVKFGWGLGLACIVAVGAILPVVLAAPPEIEAAYQRQFQALEAGDLDGHLKLALWCRDKQAYDLLMRQCNHILSVDSNHAQAKLLQELAKVHVGDPSPTPGPTDPATGQSAKSTAQGVVLLTSEQIQRLKRTELFLDRPERVQVKFNNDVLERFWQDMAARDNLARDARAAFFKLPVADKARFIMHRVRNMNYDESYGADIEIVNDPAIFNEFITRVWPIIQNGCATSGCHSGPKAQGIAFINERVQTSAMHYTNYMILHEFRNSQDQEMINRGMPHDSLLLTYGQPLDVTAQRLSHPTEIPVLYRTASDPKYQRVRRWIESLIPPKPDYGFTLEHVE